MELSPELDLLEQLAGGDMLLGVASGLFPSPERFKRVVEVYVGSGAVSLIHAGDDGERLVQPWEMRALMTDPLAWTRQPGPVAEYYLRLTPEGSRRFAADSQAFYRWLFRR